MTGQPAALSVRGDTLMLSGQIDSGSVMDVRRKGEALLADNAVLTRVNVSGVETASSVVLSLMLSWLRHAASRQRMLVFEGANERLRALAALSNLHHQLPGFAEAG
ncbi:MAG TPA: STAS domain-containing protein [Marinobacter sp.]|jgi:phospholipid transport system transporter-binding protein|nr:STAS domain-containing protein [Marinobacter sp.]